MNASAFRRAAERAATQRREAPVHPGTPPACRAAAGPLTSLRPFVCGKRGGGAIESALSLAALVTVFAGLMAVAHAAYEDDRMGRAARAAARAVALTTDAAANPATLYSAACKGIKNELGLADDFNCKTWTVTVTDDLTPSSLSSGANTGRETGDMILVTIDWKQAPWVQAVRQLDGTAGRTATGVTRREPTDS